MTHPDAAGAIHWALSLIRESLPSSCTYHNLEHTREEVMVNAVRLGQLTNQPPANLELLEVAAAFHDVGFTVSTQQHELHGMRIVAEILPSFGFDVEAVTVIMGMIMATSLAHQPQNQLEALLADADLSVLAADNFLDRNHDLYRELLGQGHPYTLKSWTEAQISFVDNYTFYTPAAQILFNPHKEKNLALLSEKLEKLSAD